MSFMISRIALILSLCSSLAILLVSGTVVSQVPELNGELGTIEDSLESQGELPINAVPIEKSLADWLWLDSSRGIIDEGISIIAPSKVDSNYLYAAGKGYVARSTNAGLSWHVVLTFNDDGIVSAQQYGDANEDREIDEDVSNRVDVLREYLRDELERQFGLEYSDYLLEQITDGDLEMAEDADSLEPLDHLDLDMDTDFNSIIVDGEQIDFEENELDLREDMAYFDQVELLILGGMDADEAARAAASGLSVWDLVEYKQEIYAVTSQALYHSADRALSWSIKSVDTGGDSILSFAISRDGDTQLLGLSEGLSVSLNGGISWSRITGSVPGAVYGLEIAPSGGVYYALTTQGVFRSFDKAASWEPLTFPVISAQSVRKIVFGKSDSHFLVLLKDDVLISEDGGNSFISLDTSLLGEANWRDLVATSDDLSEFALLSPHSVYLFSQNQWLVSNNGLMGQELFQLQTSFKGDLSELWLSTSIGLYHGIPREEDAKSAEKLSQMQRRWKAEPPDSVIIQKVYNYHVLGDLDEKKWEVRSGTSMLLPRIDFAWRQEQKKLDKPEQKFYMMRPDAEDKYRYQRNNMHHWSIMAYWNFNFDRHEKQTNQARRTLQAMRKTRSTLTKNVVKLLQKRREMQLKSINLEASTDLKLYIETILEIDYLEAQLNYLTGGYYLNAIESAKISQ